MNQNFRSHEGFRGRSRGGSHGGCRGGSRKSGYINYYTKPKASQESSMSTINQEMNYNDTTNYNPLFLAVHNGKLEDTHSLLSEDSLEEEVSGRTLIHIAAARGHEQIICLLCHREANIYHRDKDGNTPLHLAIKGNHTDVVHLLLNENTVHLKNLREATPLHIATEKDNFDFVELLIKGGAKVNEQDVDGKTPLHISTGKLNPNMEIVKFLLTHGASVNVSCKKGLTPLHVAAQVGNEEIVKLLVTKENADKINAGTVTGNTPLHYAAANGHIQVLKYLIQCGSEIHQLSFSEDTPLHLSAAAGHLEVVTELLNHGAEFDSCNCDGFTPFTLAIKARKKEVVKLLLNKGASATHSRRTYVNGEHEEVNVDVLPALHLAAKIGDEEILKIILDSGIKVDFRSKNDKTALHVAATFGHRKLVEELVKAGADINAQTQFGETPLHLAAASGRSSTVKYLLNSGAETRCTDKGYNPLHYALDRRRHDALVNSKKTPTECRRSILFDLYDDSSEEVLVTPFLFDRYLKITEMLLIKGVSQFDKTKNQKFPLDYALKIKVSREDKWEFDPSERKTNNSQQKVINEGIFCPEIVRCLFNYCDLMSSQCITLLMTGTDAINLKSLPLVDVLLEYDIYKRMNYESLLNLALKTSNLSIILAVSEQVSDIDIIVEALCTFDSSIRRLSISISEGSKTVEKDILKRLIAQIVKMRSTSKITDVAQPRELELLERKNLLEWYTQCELELMNMRERQIDPESDVTFYEILTKPVSKLGSYARNTNLMRILDSGTCGQFAAYSEFLERSVQKGKERKALIESSTECFLTLVQQYSEIELPSEIIDEIFKYFSVIDLRKLSVTIPKKSHPYYERPYGFHAEKRSEANPQKGFGGAQFPPPLRSYPVSSLQPSNLGFRGRPNRHGPRWIQPYKRGSEQ